MATAVLLMAYGTPGRPDQIEGYYTDIRRGRPPSREQLADLTARYQAIGGVSPLGRRTEHQGQAIQAALDRLDPGRYHVALGFKHTEPSIEATVDELGTAGFTHVVALVLAPHYSSMSTGQYLARARAAGAPHGMGIVGIESWATEPAFVDFLSARVAAGLDRLPPGSTVLFTAHSLPRRVIDEGDRYPDEVRSTARAVAAGVDRLDSQAGWTTAWQSAGRTPEPWLGPDVLDVIDELASSGAPGVLVCACGFVADHLEVLYDLDIEASQRAASRSMAFARTECVNDDAAVMAALAARIHAAAG